MALHQRARCLDCGEFTPLEDLHWVEWEWRGTERIERSWLMLCNKCGDRMARALATDEDSTLVFHPY